MTLGNLRATGWVLCDRQWEPNRVAEGSRRRTMSKLYPSISSLSVLMALALALGEWYFFFYGGTWEGPLGFLRQVVWASIWHG
jgi:hypothetical protein